ncbi:MAG: preprotein translocase subunit SecG [Rhizobiales bacterium]|nr:preprotein translocase subunit SecG [Hyphomicrobiales bacterium]
MQTVVIVIHLMLVLALTAVVLLQRSEGGGLGIGGGGGGGFMSSRGTTNLLTRSTAILATGFFITSLLLSWIATRDRAPSSIIPTGAPAGQSAPTSTPQGGLLDSLKKPEAPAPAPAAPAGPQAPQSK